jgi:hypothetical protein
MTCFAQHRLPKLSLIIGTLSHALETNTSNTRHKHPLSEHEREFTIAWEGDRTYTRALNRHPRAIGLPTSTPRIHLRSLMNIDLSGLEDSDLAQSVRGHSERVWRAKCVPADNRIRPIVFVMTTEIPPEASTGTYVETATTTHSVAP